MAFRIACLSTLIVAASSQASFDDDIRNRRCFDPDMDLSAVPNIRVALYSGEHSTCTNSKTGIYSNHCTNIRTNGEYPWPEISQADNTVEKIWGGYDIVLLDELSKVGNFTYTIVNMGRARNISATTDYTTMAKKVLGLVPGGPDQAVDIIGQNTWRIDKERLVWAVWSVPMVSESVVLLGLKETLAERTFESRVQIMFEPFEDEVWILLAGLFVIYTSTMLIMANRHKQTIDEVSRADVAYEACLTIFGGGGAMNHQKHHTKTISIGWIVFSILIFEIYFANLTAILSQPPEVVSSITGMKDVRNSNLPFCVQRNAANDPYFTYHPKFGNAEKGSPETAELNIVRKDSVPHQIEGVLDGSCAVTEITREDFYLWAKKSKTMDDYCRLAFIGQPITTRYRGMMAARNGSCVLTAISTIYHALGVRTCERQGSNQICDAQSILESEFPEPSCDGWSNPTIASQKKKGLGLVDLFGPFMLLALLFSVGIVVGKVASRYPESSLFSWWTLSPTARDMKVASMIHRDREAAEWLENLVHERNIKANMTAGALAVMFANNKGRLPESMSDMANPQNVCTQHQAAATQAWPDPRPTPARPQPTPNSVHPMSDRALLATGQQAGR